MDGKSNVEKPVLQLEKVISTGDSESEIIITLQQQQQPCCNEEEFVQFQHYLLQLMRTEQRLHDMNEANFQSWCLIGSHYLTTCSNVVKVLNTDFGYYLIRLQVIGGHKNTEGLRIRCRMLDSYELMMVISQSLQRIHLTFTKFLKEQNKFCWKFRLIWSYIQDLEKKMKSTDQCIKIVEITMKTATDKYA